MPRQREGIDHSVVQLLSHALVGGDALPAWLRTTDRARAERSWSGACWCGSLLQPNRQLTKSFRLLQCGSCRSYRIDPPSVTGEEESSAFYTDYYDQPGRATHAEAPGQRQRRLSRFWRVVRQVPSLGIPVESVIDFGCGDGRLCHELSVSGWADVVGVDVSRSRLARARAKHPGIRFYARPVDEVVLAQGAADLCVMDNVIEHLPQPAAVVCELRRYLRPGGKLVVITPNMESTHFRILGRWWTPELAPQVHIFLFTAASLAQLLREAGFTVQATGTIHDDPYPLRTWWARLMSGDVKGAIWRALQEVGAICGRLVGVGPMLFAIAEGPQATATKASTEAKTHAPGA